MTHTIKTDTKIATNVQLYLKKMLAENNLTRQAFADSIGIPYSSVTKLWNATRENPEFATILRIAKYFNDSLDNIVGNTASVSSKPETTEFKDITTEQLFNNLKNFLKDKLEELNIRSYKLSKDCRFSEDVIPKFLKDEPEKLKTLNSANVLAIARYFNISIDEMVKRISPLEEKKQTLDLPLDLSPEALMAVDKIKEKKQTLDLPLDLSPEALMAVDKIEEKKQTLDLPLDLSPEALMAVNKIKEGGKLLTEQHHVLKPSNSTNNIKHNKTKPRGRG